MKKTNWPIKKLGKVVDVLSGQGFPLDLQGRKDEALPFYKVSDMNLPTNSHFMVSHNNSISHEDLKKLGYKFAPPGTVIFPKIGAAITTNKKRILIKNALYDNNVIGLIPDENKTLSLYLYYWLETFDISKWASDSNLPSIRKSTIEQCEVAVPSMSMQKKIVERLDAIRKAQELNNLQISKTEELFESLINNFQEKYKTEDLIEFGELIEGEITNGLYKEASSYGSGTLILDIKSVYNGYFVDFSESRRVQTTDKELERYKLSDNELLFNRVSKKPEGVGKVALVRKVQELVVFESNMMRVRVKENEVSSEFLVYLLNTPNYRAQTVNKSKIANQSSINQRGLKSLRLLRPSLKDQKKIVEKLSSVQEHKKLLLKQKSLLAELFDSVLDKCMKGELVN